MRQLTITRPILLFLCVMMLVSCTVPKKTIYDILENNYLSITFTHVTDVENKFDMDTYMYDFKSQEINHMSQITYNAQYPLTYYDKEKNCVYYTKRIGDSHDDEVYAYDCATKNSKKLTDGIFAVNAMYKISDNELALIAVKDSVLLQLFVLNTDDLQLEEISYGKYTISAQYYDLYNHKMILAGYDEEQEYRVRDDYNNGLIDEYPVNSKIWEYDFRLKKFQDIDTVTVNMGYIESLVGNQDDIYYQMGVISDEYHKYIMKYNRKTHQTEEITQLNSVYSLVAITEDSNIIIYISNQGRGSSSLRFFDFNTEEDKKIFSSEIEGQINNAFLGK